MTDFVQTLKQLLPRGRAWQRGLGTVAHALYEGLVVEAGRVKDRAEELLAEMDPRTTTELIADWERVCGLPDPCTTAPTTLADRRAAVVARLTSRGGWSGGPSEPFLIRLMVALGYAEESIVIRRNHLDPFTCESECDDFLYSDDGGWRFLWEIIAVHNDTLDNALICQVTRYAAAHLGLTFAFPLTHFGAGTFSRAGTGSLVDPETGEVAALAEDELGTIYLGV